MTKDSGRNHEIRERIVDFISEFNRANGYSPTIREVGQAVGLKSASSALFHIQALVKEGVLSGGGLPRSLVVSGGCERETIVQRVCIDLESGQKVHLDCRIEKPKGASVDVSIHRVRDEIPLEEEAAYSIPREIETEGKVDAEEIQTNWQQEYACGSGKMPIFKRGQEFFVRGTRQLNMGAFGIVLVNGHQMVGQVVSDGLRLYQFSESSWVDAHGVPYKVVAEIIGVRGDKIGKESSLGHSL